MHNLKPNTDYVILSLQVAVKKEDFESSAHADGMNGVMDCAMFEEDGSDGIVADWQFATRDADYEHRTDDNPEEGETFTGTKEFVIERFPVCESLPLRLAVCPSAIRGHFEEDDRITNMSEEQLMHIGERVLSSDAFYKAFHEALCAATEEVAGFNPDDRRSP